MRPSTLSFPVLEETPLHLARVQVHVLRHRIDQPVMTSFGVMHERPAALVRVEDKDGASGWGEIWCNFPACGAEHRARLVDTVLAPLLLKTPFASPQDAFAHLSRSTAVLAIQSGEPGPFAQAIAGLDLALWDLVARRQKKPLWRLLGGTSDCVQVYASGLNPDAPEQLVARRRSQGHRAFKLKIGFGAARDLDNLARVREAAGPEAALMVDANQAWDLPAALQRLPELAQLGLAWVEEPLRADRPWTEWQILSQQASVALAAGENVASEAAFEALLASGAVQVVQPDVAK